MVADTAADPNENAREARDVFVSYSRTDQAMVQRLCEALTHQGRKLWVDWGSIHPSAEWFAEVERGIRSASAFVFVISPESVASEICQRELELAVQFNKRLVPVICRDAKSQDIQPELQKRHWVFLREQDDFDEGFESLTQALDVDIDWLHRHTEQLAQALAWSDSGRDKSRLLKGSALQQAETWLVEGAHKEPSPAAVQLEFIQASRRAATSRLRRVLAGAVVGLIVAAVLTAWALFASYAAKVARDEAVARRLGAEAALVTSERDSLIERSALLAIESWRRKPSLENDVPLRRALPLLPVPVAGWGDWTKPVNDAVFVGSGVAVAYAVEKDVVIAHTSDPTSPQRLPHTSAVRQLVACADGRTLVTRTAQGRVFFWNVQTLKLVSLLPNTNAATKILCSVDGQVLAVGRGNGLVALYQAADGKHERDLLGELASKIGSLAFSEDMRQVAAGGSKRLQVWDRESGAVVASVEHRHPVLDIAFDPAGQRIAAASDSSVYLWSLPDGAQIKRLRHQTNVDAVAFDNAGKRLVSACGDYNAYVWNASTLRRIGRLRHQGPVTDVKFSADDTSILTASNDDTARLWDARNGKEILRFAHNRVVATVGTQHFVVSADFDQTGRRVLTAGRDGRVRVWNSGPQEKRVYLAKTRFTNGRRWSRDGRFVAEKLAEKHWEIRETLSGRSVLQFESERGVLTFAMGPAERRVAISTNSGEINVVSITDGRLLQSIKLPDVADTLSFHPNQNRLVTGSRDMFVRYWSFDDGQLLWEKHHGGLLMSSAFSADGELIATGGTNRLARVWRATNGSPAHDLKHPHDVKDVAFSPDGQMLATACSDGTARKWDLASTMVDDYMQHQFPIVSIAYDPSGEWIATGSTDKTARIWSAATGIEQSRIETEEVVQRIGFVDDARLLVATDREVSTHFVVGRELVDAACERLTRNLSLVEWAQYLGSEQPRATCPKLPDPVL